jgi:streptogrisin C
VVRDAAGQLGITTAAHCPDTLSWRGPDGEERLLPLLGAWGAAQNDVQIHGGVGPAEPIVFSNSAKTMVRPITSWATRPMTRPGDWLCLRGESSGYACAEVELTDFAPAGELCGGLCTSSWVTMRGPECRRGDSGAPIFLGSVAYGVLKGGAYLPDGTCAFSYYQSVDYLPEGWRVAVAPLTGR